MPVTSTGDRTPGLFYSALMTSISDTASALQPLCPVHAERVAEKTCERCGRYFCSHCLSRGERCQECLRRYLAAIPSSESRARRAMLSLRMIAVLAVCQMILTLGAVFVLGAREPPESMETFATLAMFLTGVKLILFPLTTVFYLMWIHRAVRQMNAWGIDVGASPAWAVGCWLVPFVNLVKPLRLMQNIDKGLKSEGLAVSLHLVVLWSVFLWSRGLAWVARHLSGWFVPRSLWVKAYLIEISSWGCTLIAAMLCARMVREVQVRLESRRSRI